MGRRDSPLDSKTARLKLKQRETGLLRPGRPRYASWLRPPQTLLRRLARSRDDRRTVHARHVATADDALFADGRMVLRFYTQAVSWFRERRPSPSTEPITVKRAVEAYLVDLASQRARDRGQAACRQAHSSRCWASRVAKLTKAPIECG